MARPLRGTVKATATGFRAEVPAAVGSPRRISRTFPDEASAESWRAAAIDALTGGRAIPEPDDVPTAGPASGPAASFPAASDGWLEEYYLLDNRAQAERAEDAGRELRRVARYLDTTGATPATLTRVAYQEVLRQLAGTAEGPLNKRISAARRAAGVTREGYSQQQINDTANNIAKMLLWCRDRHGVVLLFDPAAVATPRTTRPATQRRAPLTLEQAGILAADLHPVHAFALLLSRVLGLRISEAYGFLVSDYLADPERGRAVLHVWAQGGRKFAKFDEDGNTIQSTRKESLKTIQSERFLPVCRELQKLIDLVITVFHTDPDSGRVDPTARLIPDLNDRDSGQAAFRSAVQTAAKRVGLVAELDDGIGHPVGLRPHDLRRASLTDLAHAGGFPIEVRERFAGHHPGESVHSSYILDSPMFAELAPLAERMDEAVREALPGGLVIPTRLRCTKKMQAALHVRRAHIDAALEAAGWLVTSDDHGDVLDARELGRMLGIATGTARRWLRSGELPTVPLPGGRGDQRGIRVADAAELEEAWNTGQRIGALADELGLQVASIHQVAKAKGWTITKRGGVAFVDDATAALIRDWRRALDTARADGLTHAAAARELDVAPAVVKHWLSTGVLKPLAANPDYICRRSVAERKAQTRRGGRRAR